MGKIKQLLPWKQTTLLGNSIEQALKSDIADVYVILGSDYKILYDSIVNYNVSVIYNDNWEKGMGSSISVAIKKISKNSYDAVIIALADQPLITSEDFNALIRHYKSTDKGIVSIQMNSIFGVPAIFNKKYFTQLKALNDQYGARFIISKNLNDNISINISDHYLDVDTIEEYQNLISKQK